MSLIDIFKQYLCCIRLDKIHSDEDKEELSFRYIKTINSFNEINLHNLKTLIICDIDDTLLFQKKVCNYQNKIFVSLKRNNNDEWTKKNLSLKITHTDPIGFNLLLNKIKQTNSKLIFLTSRSIYIQNITKNDFTQIGLNYDNYKIYYTSGLILKGEYIKKYIDINKYEQIIFIDNDIHELNSIFTYLNNVKCYQFVNNNN